MSTGDQSATALVGQLKGLDSSNVEVDEEQVAPLIGAGSAEEKALLAKMQELLAVAGDVDAIAADDQIKLLCLRGRKYDPERAAELLPKHIAFKKEFGIGAAPYGDQLLDDIRSQKLCHLGTKDADGRAVLWIRLCHHDPSKSKAEDMARLIPTVMLSALTDPDVQRLGITIVQDMTGLKLKNLDPATAKMLMGRVFPNLPIRIGRICIFNPPWVVGHIILPIALTLMSKKLRGRIALIKDSDHAKLLPYVPASSLPTELGGTAQFDEGKWSEGLIASLNVPVKV